MYSKRFNTDNKPREFPKISHRTPQPQFSPGELAHFLGLIRILLAMKGVLN